MKTIKVKKLDEKAKLPQRAHDTDTGYDLTMIGVEKIVGDVIFFKTGIAVQPPKGHYLEIVPRSSISKLPLELANSVGIIDEAYRGEVLIPVRVTHGEMGQEQGNVTFASGIVKIFGVRPVSMSALAQLILQKQPVLFQAIVKQRIDAEFLEASLDDTERGEGGFGSTDSMTSSSIRKELLKVG